MNQTDRNEDTPSRFDMIGLIKTHGPMAVKVAVVAAVLVALTGVVYLKWGQAVRQITALEFRPTFTGARQMQYPNKLPFSPTDVNAGAILDLVYDRSEIGSACGREAFRGGFFVEQRSDQSVMLDLEFQQRLSEPRITPVERRQLQEEYAAKRMALPLQFRLVFITPQACQGLPRAVVAKIMTDVLATWASESETKRGVLNHQVEVLTPATLDVKLGGPGGWVLRADLLRTALERIIKNVEEVSTLPGAVLVRLGPGRLTFMEVRGKLIDLVGAKLEPLVMTSGRSLVKESLVWVNETVASAERDQVAALGRAKAFQDALREYSGAAQSADANRATATTSTGAAGIPTLVPQIDRSFIDRIIEMSAANAVFRRELTEDMVKATVEAVTAQNRASYYRRLLQSLREPGGGQAAAENLDKDLDEIVAEGKELTKHFGELYDEFSRVALRSAASMYQTDKPVTIEVSRSFTSRALINLVGGTFVAFLFLTLVYFVIRDRFRTEAR